METEHLHPSILPDADIPKQCTDMELLFLDNLLYEHLYDLIFLFSSILLDHKQHIVQENSDISTPDVSVNENIK